nr:hypothetical protein [Tanacetum cinerariifolium]
MRRGVGGLGVVFVSAARKEPQGGDELVLWPWNSKEMLVSYLEAKVVARIESITIKEYELESKVFDLLKIDLDLFTYDTPLGIILDDFKRLSSIKDYLFAYELGVLEDFCFPYVEQLYDNLKNSDFDVYEPRQCYDEYERMFVEAVILIDDRLIYWKKGDDEEVLTDDELSNLEEEDLSEDNEIAKVFRIETNIFLFETPLCKAFKEFNHLLYIDVDVLTDDLPRFKTYEDYKNAWICECNKEVPWKNIGGERKKKKNQVKMLGVITYNDAIQKNQEWFDYHVPIEDDDDIRDLDDYLIQNDASYYVDEEEERFKEMKSKLLGIPYEKPPTFKYEKFKVIKYSSRPAEEYVAIKEYEYDIWVRTKENVSHVYQEIFQKKYEGLSVTCAK